MKKIKKEKALIGMLCLIIFVGNIYVPSMRFQTENVEQECVLRKTQAEMNTVVDFEIVTENRAYVGTVLNLDSITLRNVRYADGTVQDSVSSGFYFIDSKGKESNFYEITQMDNQITILYDGCMKSYDVTGIIPENLKIEADYVGGSVYAGEEIDVAAILLKVNLNIEGVLEYEVKGSEKNINLEDYTIQAGNNVISGTYDFYETDQEIPFTVIVKGKENPVQKMTATYKGASKVGTKVTPQDFKIELTLESGKKVKSEIIPSIYDYIVLSGDTLLVNGVNTVHIVYAGSEISTDCKIDLSGVPNVVKPGQTATPLPGTNAPRQTATPVPGTNEPGQTATPLPGTNEPGQTATPVSGTNEPRQTEPGIATREPISTIEPLITGTPDITKESTATPSVSEMPSATTIPAVKVGKNYTVSGICYKVISYGKSAKTKTVTITGYKKSATKIVLKNTVSIQGKSFRVVSIGNSAFKNCKKIKGKLVIPAYVTKIGNYTFMGCSNIRNVELPKSVRRIGKKSFYNCKKLADFWFKGKTIDYVGADALKKQKVGRIIAFPPGRKKYYSQKLKGKY